MSILDRLVLFGDAQVITASAASIDTLDLSAVADVGA
jgi:hypothetical protein